MPSQYSEEEQGRAMVLLGQGYNSYQVSAQTGIPDRTLRNWALSPQMAEKYADAIKAGRERIAYRWTTIVDRVLDKIEDDPDILKHLTPVAAMTGWGIATDKVQKDAQQVAPESLITQLLADRAQRIRYRTVTEYEVITNTPPDHEALP